MVSGHERAGQSRCLPRRPSGTRVLHRIRAQVHRGRAFIIELDKVILVSRTAIAAATVNLADHDCASPRRRRNRRRRFSRATSPLMWRAGRKECITGVSLNLVRRGVVVRPIHAANACDVRHLHRNDAR